MNKKLVIISGLIVLAVVSLFSIKFFIKTDETKNTSVLGSTQTTSIPPQTEDNFSSTNEKTTPADKIEVVHFHGTQQCWTCITVGKYTLKAIKEKFPDEYGSGRITFKDINVELKENQEIVIKYQAMGSSLYINAIRGNKDDITNDLTVWRLVNNENQFISYFEGKLKSLLGK
ncbi:MAG TPA: nitrophenyl compound nitroreductase subunit ArsF family protein [Candidatus Bathyarchaeia archaeon]|nr:nitrophenyl compound nitroreductase subunit ArsF family protein [Candidatus Bathyarchaeia archaeon]